MNKKEKNWSEELRKSKRNLNMVINEYKYHHKESETIVNADQFNNSKIIFKEPIIKNEFKNTSERINKEFNKFVFDNKDIINEYFLNFFELSKRQNAKSENNRIGFTNFITKLITIYFIDINDFNDCFNNLMEILDENNIVNIFLLLSYIENSILIRIVGINENYSYDNNILEICSNKNHSMGWKRTWQIVFENEERSLSFYLFNDTSYIINEHEEKYKRKFYNFFALLSNMCEFFMNKSLIDRSRSSDVKKFIIYLLINDLSLFNKYLMMINYKKSKDIMSSFLNIFIKLFIFDILSKEKKQIQALMAHFINNNYMISLVENYDLSYFTLFLGNYYYNNRIFRYDHNNNLNKYYLVKNGGLLFSNCFIIDMEDFDIENNCNLFDLVPDFNQNTNDIIENFNIKYHTRMDFSGNKILKNESMYYKDIKMDIFCFDGLEYFRNFIGNIECYDGWDEILTFEYEYTTHNKAIKNIIPKVYKYNRNYGTKFSLLSDKQKLFYNNYDFIQLFLDIFKDVFKNSKNENKYTLIKYIFESKKITNEIKCINKITENDFISEEINKNENNKEYCYNYEDYKSKIAENAKKIYNNIFFKDYLSNSLKKSDLKENDNHFALITDFRNTNLDNILIVERNGEYYEVKRSGNIFVQLFKLFFEEESANDIKLSKIALKA